jgi:hypothetical protein
VAVLAADQDPSVRSGIPDPEGRQAAAVLGRRQIGEVWSMTFPGMDDQQSRCPGGGEKVL